MEDCLNQYWETLNEYIAKFAPAETKYSKEDFQADLTTYKTIGLVLATTLMPNVLSQTQPEAGGLMALREMQRKQAAELQDDENRASKEIRRRITGLVLLLDTSLSESVSTVCLQLRFLFLPIIGEVG